MKLDSNKATQQQCHLYLGLWKILFVEIWEQSNAFIHGKDSMSMKYEQTQLVNKPHEWIMVANGRLGHSQQYLANYSYEEIPAWKTTTMRETAQLLVKVLDNQEAYMLDKTQLRVIDYFGPIEHDKTNDDG